MFSKQLNERESNHLNFRSLNRMTAPSWLLVIYFGLLDILLVWNQTEPKGKCKREATHPLIRTKWTELQVRKHPKFLLPLAHRVRTYHKHDSLECLQCLRSPFFPVYIKYRAAIDEALINVDIASVNTFRILTVPSRRSWVRKSKREQLFKTANVLAKMSLTYCF